MDDIDAEAGGQQTGWVDNDHDDDDDDGDRPTPRSGIRDTLDDARAKRLRAQMQADALEPLGEDIEDSLITPNNNQRDHIDVTTTTTNKDTLEFSAEEVAQARSFLQAPVRLIFVHSPRYIRTL